MFRPSINHIQLYKTLYEYIFLYKLYTISTSLEKLFLPEVTDYRKMSILGLTSPQQWLSVGFVHAWIALNCQYINRLSFHKKKSRIFPASLWRTVCGRISIIFEPGQKKEASDVSEVWIIVKKKKCLFFQCFYIFMCIHPRHSHCLFIMYVYLLF